MIVVSLRLVGIYPLESRIGILAVIQVDAEIDFPVSENGAVLEAELGFLFGRAEAEHQVVRTAVIVLPVFGVAVVQITVADYRRLYVRAGIMAVHGSKVNVSCLILGR